jgi:hypothetical protein
MNQPFVTLPAGPDDSITAIEAWRNNNFIALRWTTNLHA